MTITELEPYNANHITECHLKSLSLSGYICLLEEFSSLQQSKHIVHQFVVYQQHTSILQRSVLIYIGHFFNNHKDLDVNVLAS